MAWSGWPCISKTWRASGIWPGIQRTYGDIWLPLEKGQCTYNFEASNPERLHQLFAIYEAEATDLVARRLPAPALDYVLKCSHTFNLLEARGVISVTERTASIGRIRALARQVAEAWLAEREALGFPLLAEPQRA